MDNDEDICNDPNCFWSRKGVRHEISEHQNISELSIWRKPYSKFGAVGCYLLVSTFVLYLNLFYWVYPYPLLSDSFFGTMAIYAFLFGVGIVSIIGAVLLFSRRKKGRQISLIALILWTITEAVIFWLFFLILLSWNLLFFMASIIWFIPNGIMYVLLIKGWKTIDSKYLT